MEHKDVKLKSGFETVDKSNLKDALQYYTDLLYREEILNDQTIKSELNELRTNLSLFYSDIKAMAFKTDETKDNNATLFCLNSGHTNMQNVAIWQKILMKYGVELAGYMYILEHASRATSTYKTDLQNLEKAFEFMDQLLHSNDKNVVKKCLVFLKDDENRNFTTLFLQKYPLSVKLQKEYAALPAKEIKIEEENKQSTSKSPVLKDGFIFLSALKEKLGEGTYDKLGINWLGEHSVPDNIAKLKKALKDLPETQSPENNDKILKIFREVRSIIQDIKPPKRDDQIEKFYHDQKANLDKKNVNKKEFLDQLRENVVGNKEFEKLGKGLMGGSKVPGHFVELREILTNEHLGDDEKFARVSKILKDIKVERHPDLRTLYNDLKEDIKNYREPVPILSSRFEHDL